MAPGSGGIWNKFLVAMGERVDDNEMKQLVRLGMAYIRAELPTWFNKVWLSLQTVALYKSAEKVYVRPIGLRNSLVKMFHREVMSQCKTELRQYLEPVQLGMSLAGAAKLVFSVGGAIRANREQICIKIDLKNAFNECSKTAIIKVI